MVRLIDQMIHSFLLYVRNGYAFKKFAFVKKKMQDRQDKDKTY